MMMSPSDVTEYQQASQQQLDEAFLEACRKLNYPVMEFLLYSPEIPLHCRIDCQQCSALYIATIKDDIDLAGWLLQRWPAMDTVTLYEKINFCLYQACQFGKVSIAKYFLQQQEAMVKDGSMLNLRLNTLNGCLRRACRYGCLELVQYVLTSAELCLHADIHCADDWSLRHACENKDLSIIRYLLTSPELREHANIHAKDDDALHIAFEHCHQHIVSYLLYSPELQEHASFRQQDLSRFVMFAYRLQWSDILHTLVLNHDVTIDEKLQQFICEHTDLGLLFEKKALKSNLTTNLEEKTRGKKTKV